MRRLVTGLLMAGMLTLSACTSGSTVFTEGATPGVEIQQRPALFLESTDQSPSERFSAQPRVKRARTALLNPDIVNGPDWVDELDQVELNLFEDVVVDVRRQRVERAPSGNLSWIGQSADGQTTVTLTAHDKMLIALVVGPAGTFRITSQGDGQVVIQEKSANGFECGEVPVPPELPPQAREDIQALTNEGLIIDVMQLYTQQLADQYIPGGSAAAQLAFMQTQCDNDVAWLNQAYINSDVGITMRNVHVQLISYTQSGDASTDLYRLTGVGESNAGVGTTPIDDGEGNAWKNGGPYLESAHTLRNTHGADLVMLRCSTFGAGIGGVGWVTLTANTGYNVYGFAVMANPNDTEITMAHEFAHNQGLHHDFVTNGNQFAAPPYAMGYRVVNSFATITAYPSPVDFNLYVQYFSNPALTVVPPGGGAAVPLTDTSQSGDNRPDEHRRLNELVDTISNFRTHVEAYAPDAPSNLAGVPATPTSANITWNDNSEGEDRFELQRKLQSGNGTSWITLNRPANSTSFNNTGLVDGEAYNYRIRSVIGSETSPFSASILVRLKPNAPSDVAGVALDEDRIQLTWTDNSASEDNHKIWRRLGTSGAYVNVASPAGADLETFTDTGLNASTRYYYFVRAARGNLSSANSNVVSVLTGPARPTSPAAAVQSPSSILFSWGDASSDESGFRIQRRIGAGSFVTIANRPAGTTSFLNTGLTAGTQYSYRVQAYRGSVNSTFTAAASATP